MTATRTPHDQHEAAYDRAISDLFEGRSFARWGFPDVIARYHGGAVGSRSYGAAMGVVAKFATMGDWSASIAAKVFHGTNLYSTSNEFRAQINRAISEAASKGYYDVIGATGPEASRPSAHQHETTEHQWMTLYCLHTEVEMAMAEVYTIGHVPCVGWPYARWMQENGFSVSPVYFPRVAKALAR